MKALLYLLAFALLLQSAAACYTCNDTTALLMLQVNTVRNEQGKYRNTGYKKPVIALLNRT